MAESKVTSVGLKGPDGFDIINSPITSRGNLEFAFSRGFTLPSISRQTSWDRAYADSHRHINKIILDEITEENIINWNDAVAHSSFQGNPHNITFKDILNRPNTLGEYGIVDAYTKEEVRHLFNALPPSNGNGGITILTKDSWAVETDSNVYSALRTRKELDDLRELIANSGSSLNHTHSNKLIIDSITQEHLDILSLLSIDEGNLKVGTNLFSIGEISAYGLGPGSGGGGGSLVVWGTESNGTIPLTVEGITKTLALKSGLDLKQDKLLAGNGITITGNTISANIQDLNWDNIIGKPTTLLGYGITDAVAKTVFDAHATDEIKHITTSERTNWNDANTKKHTHPNKPVIDQLTQADINVLAKLSLVDGNLKVDTNLYSTGEVSAYGLGSGSGGGGGGSLVSWGTESNSFIPLTVEGISKTVALQGHTHTKAQIGLGNVDNTSDLLKPISTATQTALNSKFNVPTGTASQYIRGDGSLATYTDTTYSLMSLAELDTGTATTNRVVNSKNLNDWLSGKGYALSNHTHTFASLTSKPTTLAGYGITDAYTKAQVDSSLSGKVSKSGDTMTGNLTAPTFIGALSGNATTATTATNLSRSIIAGNGLSGGGVMTADRTITLGTPSNITLSSTNSVTSTSHTHNFTLGGTASQYLNGATTLVTIPTVTAGNGLTGGGQLTSGITLTLATPGTLTAATTNGVTASSHTHAITTTSVGLANTIIQTDATGGTKLNNLMVGGAWKLEQVGTELQLKYNNVVAQRFLLDGSIVGLGEITAYGASTGGEGVSLLRTGGTMTGNLTMSADIIMNSGRSIGKSNLPLKLLGNALTYNASNILTEANTANQIKMGNGWTIEQTTASLTIRKNGVIKGTFNA